MAGLTAVLLISISMVLQNSIVTRLQMLEGAADLVLLVLISWIMLSDQKKPWHWGALPGCWWGSHQQSRCGSRW